MGKLSPFDLMPFDGSAIFDMQLIAGDTALTVAVSGGARIIRNTDRELQINLTCEDCHIRINTIDHTIEINGETNMEYTGELFDLHPGYNQLTISTIGGDENNRLSGTLTYRDRYY